MRKVQIDKVKFLASSPITLSVDGQALLAKPREFKSGSLGYYATGKVLAIVDGKPVQVQVGANLTICGTKPDGGDEGEGTGE